MNLVQNCVFLVILCLANLSIAKKNEFKTKQISVEGNPKKFFYPKPSTTKGIPVSVEGTENSVVNLVKNRHRRAIDDNIIWPSTEDWSESTPTVKMPEQPTRHKTPSLRQNDVPHVIQEDFERNCSGEYKFEFRMSDGTRRAEVGEFEERNGCRIFVIRGVFAYLNQNKDYKIKAYIIDDSGHHDVAIPVITSPEGITDFRPDAEGGCEPKLGEYCIDQKLLTIMVG